MTTLTIRRISVLATVGALPLFALGPISSVGADPVTQDFTVPGALDFEVPAGVCQLDVVVLGAQGGASTFQIDEDPAEIGSPGGEAASASATLEVSPGELLIVTVGEAGGDGFVHYNPFGDVDSSDPGDGGFNGGGDGQQVADPDAEIDDLALGGGGGGASDIRRGGSALTDRVIVAGGGGGGGGFGDSDVGGGAGGDPDGAAGTSGTNTTGGAGGTTAAGGAAGADQGGGTTATAGSLGQGGDGGTGTAGGDGDFNGSGGGGGGGHFGGGGGGAVLDGGGSSGAGGGGSSFGEGATFGPSLDKGDGTVTITYDLDDQPNDCGTPPVDDPEPAAPVVAPVRFTG